MASPTSSKVTTRSQTRRDPAYDRLLASVPCITSKSHSPILPYEWIASPKTTKEDFDNVWRKIVNEHNFDHVNQHLTKAELKAVKSHLAFTRLHNKPLFSPYAPTGASYSQVKVDMGLRESTHTMAAAYRVRWLVPKPQQVPPDKLEEILGRSGFKSAYCASHLVCNYKGCTHDINPWNLTLEPMDINSSRRTCMLGWAKDEHMATHPGDSLKDFYAEGDRSPLVAIPEGADAYTSVVCCCEGLHDPPCMAYHGQVPDAIKERVVEEEHRVLDRKEAKKRKKQEDEAKERASKKLEKRRKKED